MRIDLTCPIELSHYALPDGSRSECCFVLKNISDHTIVSVQITLACRARDLPAPVIQKQRFQGLFTAPGEDAELYYEPDIWRPDFTNVDIIIEKVWFDNASHWSREQTRLAEYQPNRLVPGAELDKLRFIAGDGAVGYPQMQQNVWLCVCGRPNALNAAVCCRCHQSREKVFSTFSKEEVDRANEENTSRLMEAARIAREKSSQMREQREKQEMIEQKRKRSRLRVGAYLLVFAVLLGAFAVWGWPEAERFAVSRYIEKGQYDGARDMLSQMETSPKTEELLRECDYSEARSLAEKGDDVSLEKACAIYNRLGDYEDSQEKTKQIAYALGESYYGKGEYDAAAEKFSWLGTYKDSAERYTQTVYQQAVSMMEAGVYDSARMLFLAIPDYQDSEEKEIECGYRLAQSYMKEGNWEAALGELEDLNGYADADELTKQARYQLASEYYDGGDYDSAADLFAVAGDYQDAQQKSKECYYKLAIQKNEAENYEEALSLFRKAEDYEDAPQQVENCMYRLASQAMEEGGYEQAIALYGDTASDQLSQESIALLGECHYKLAQTALDSGEREAAEAELENAASYGKAQKELNVLRYSLAEAAFEAGDYEDALPRYVALEDYKNSQTRVKVCRYALAEKAVSAGDYDTAIDLYSLLNGYKDSEKLLVECQYQKAMELKAAGDLEGAKTILTELKGEKAQAALDEVYKDIGHILESEGNYNEAADVYALMKGTEGATLRQAALYASAESMETAGNLLEAADIYAYLGTYSDAASKCAECKRKYWGDSAETALALMQEKDYAGVVKALEGQNVEAMSLSYPELPQVWLEACYLYAESLYNSGEPYKAIPYYQKAGSYQESDTKKLMRTPYLLLGDWQSEDGTGASFQNDGLCTIAGRILRFRVGGSSLYTGTAAADMSITHKINAVDQQRLVLKDLESGTEYVFTRVGEWTLPTVQTGDTPAEEPSEESHGA